MTSLSAADIVSRYSCELVARDHDAAKQIHFKGVSTLQLAGPQHVSFLANERYLNEVMNSKAGAVLCSRKNADVLRDKVTCALFVCADPYAAFARVSQFFFKPVHPFQGVSDKAVIDASAKVDPSATVFPFCFVGPGAVVGARAVLYSGVFLGAASEVGEDSILYPNAVVREGCKLGARCILNPGAVIGGEGFGFAPSGMENIKIPQVGGVQIADDVEVGSNSSIDRGALADTTIGTQTKIDSLVQVGHNTQIGKACFLAGQVGVAGSVVVGNRVTLAGQVGVAGHLKINDEITVLAQGGVTKSLLEKGLYNGTPARPSSQYLRELATLSRLAKAKVKKSTEDK